MRKLKIIWAYIQAAIYCYFHPSHMVYTEESRWENKASRTTLVGTATGSLRNGAPKPQKTFYREAK